MNTDNTLNTLIDRTISAIDKSLDRCVGDMSLRQALELVGVLMDMRERQRVYVERTTPKACSKMCVKKPKSNKTDGL